MSPVFASYFEPFFVCQTVSLGDGLFYQFDANLGGKVYKKRIALRGRGRSSY
jgi:hypothetical protein